jgi:hypothetical protein
MIVNVDLGEGTSCSDLNLYAFSAFFLKETADIVSEVIGPRESI